MPLAKQPVLRQVTKILIPFVIVFGLYVITHGDYGPGGGFQGGVILAAAYILFALVYGVARARRVIPRKATDVLAAVGVLFYGAVGLVGLFGGGTFLDYDFLGTDPASAQALGMFLVELGVGLTVASVMVTVFTEMVEA
ncbi:MAG: Na(+)/H(+) antiporter subunit B [Planctomycetes bacterium]|nr:Na(+)/H(+) antiporter subunit B [Planctomycetota bacterium]